MIISRIRSDGRPVPNWLLVYGSGIVLAEVVMVLVGIAAGATLQAFLLLALASHNAFAMTPKDPQIPVLALLPLVRLLSLAMPVEVGGQIVWYVVVGGLTLVAIAVTIRAIGIGPSRLGLGPPRPLALQLAIAALGIPVGAALFALGVSLELRGEPSFAVAVVVSAVFVALPEELIFRGLLQHTAAIRAPRLSVAIPSVLYAAMYLGNGGGAALAMGTIGLLLSTAVARTGLLWGAIGAQVSLRVVAELMAR